MSRNAPLQHSPGILSWTLFGNLLVRLEGKGVPGNCEFEGSQTQPSISSQEVIATQGKERMRLFCLQLEASCLQWSFFTYS